MQHSTAWLAQNGSFHVKVGKERLTRGLLLWIRDFTRKIPLFELLAQLCLDWSLMTVTTETRSRSASMFRSRNGQ